MHKRNGPTILTILGFYLLTCAVQWERVDAELICPAFVSGSASYIATAEWYNTAASNLLQSANLYIQGVAQASCCAVNLTCTLQDTFLRFSNLISITIVAMNKDYQIICNATGAATNFITAAGNYTVTWQLQYGTYSESCALTQGKAVDECNDDTTGTSPCLNNGSCINIESGFNCQCKTGYFGYICDHSSDNQACTSSSSKIVLWENMTSPQMSVSCQNINVYQNISDLMVLKQFPSDVLRSVFNTNNTSVSFSLNVFNYRPGVYNFIVDISLMDRYFHQLVTVFVYNPPKFLTHFVKKILSENVTAGTEVLNMTAITDNVPSALSYSFADMPAGTFLFSVDNTGIIRVAQQVYNSLYLFNISLKVFDTLTNLSDTATIEVNISDVNQPPVCVKIISVTYVNITASKVMLGQITCKDPDRMEEYSRLNYSVKAEPSSVKITIDGSGSVILTDPLSHNITSFIVYVTVQDIEFKVYSNFTVVVINDFPSCNVSKDVLFLWETQTSDVLQMKCDTVEPGNIHNVTFSRANAVPLDIFTVVTITDRNLQTLGFNISLLNYVPFVYNVTLILFVNGVQINKEITIFVSNPPKFSLNFWRSTILQNATVGSAVVIAPALSQHALTYSLIQPATSFSDPGLYFSVDGNGIVKVNRILNNNLVSLFNLTLQAKDSVTNQTSIATIEVTIVDVNEPPVCDLMFSVKSVNTSVSSKMLAHITCNDPDKSENMTKLYYSVKAGPSTVNLTIDETGNVLLSNQLPLNITSFVVYVTVRDIDFEVYLNFTVFVINDYPFCSVSKSVLVLSETQKNDALQLICETIEPGNIHNLTFSRASTVPANILNVTLKERTIQTLGFNISYWNFVSSTCNVTLIFFVNGVQVTKEITVLVSNPPIFPLSFIEIKLLQNVTVGTTVFNASAISDHVLNYSLSNSANSSDATLYFSVDSKGNLKVNEKIKDNLLSKLDMILQAKDSVTNQTNSTTIKVTIVDVNEPPVCDLMYSIKSVYTTTPKDTLLGGVSCIDPDRNVEFTQLNYSIKAVPSLVIVNIDQYGYIWLTGPIPYNVSSFVVYATVRDYSFGVYVNFTVDVINDVPYCVMSKNTSVLSTTSAMDLISITCDTLDPGNIHSWTSPQTNVSCPGTVQVIPIESNFTIELSISLTVYSPTKCNISTTVIINGQSITKSVTTLVYKRPEFIQPSVSVQIMQNISKGSEIYNMTVISDSPGPLNYSIIWSKAGASIPMASYVYMNETTGILQSIAEIPNSVVGTHYFNVMVIDKLTNLKNTGQLNVTIEDVNEPPQCHIVYVMPIYSTSPPGSYISRINCSDNDVTPEFKTAKYSLKTEPNVVQLTVNQTGHIMLSAALPANINSFDVNVTVEDLDLRLYFKFSVNVSNDIPNCFLSNNILLLSENNTRGYVNLTCETVIPGIVRNLSFSSVDNSCNKSVHVNNFEINLTTLGFNFTLLIYNAGQCKVLLNVFVNGLKIEKNIIVLVYNRPKIPITTAYILQNITNGTQVVKMSALSDSPGPLQYILMINTSEKAYFEIDKETGTIWSISEIPNIPNGTITLTVKVTDIFTNLSSTAELAVTIEDVNEPPQCHIDNVMPINSTSPPVPYMIFHISCSDNDFRADFTRLIYSVKAEPSSVLVNITADGKIYLLHKPDYVIIINITVTVVDFSFTLSYYYIYDTNARYCSGDEITNVTLAPSLFEFPCPGNYIGNITRVCNSNATWRDVSYINCTRKSLQKVAAMTSAIVANQTAMNTTQLNQQILDIATELNSTFSSEKPAFSGDIKQTLNVLDNISIVVEKQNLTLQDDTLNKLASVANYLLLANTSSWSDLNNKQQNSGSALISIMDYFATNSLSTINNDSLILRNTLAIVRGVSLEDIYFPKQMSSQANEHDWTTTFKNTLFLPKEAFSGTSSVKYSIIAYRDSSEKFQINQTLQNKFNETKYISFGSEILTFSVNTNETIKKNLQLTFQLTNVSESTKPNCGFLKNPLSENGFWSAQGCILESFVNLAVKCSCNHLTNFAILMSPVQVESESSVVLSIISTIGCAISIFCLVVTIFVYALVWRHVKNDRSVLHMNLCVCLIICYILFLAGVDKSDDEVGCKVVAALLHFFYLVVFFTMLSEGIHIFKAVVFVFKKESMLHILLPFIYGVPLVIVAISLGVTKTEGYVSDKYCWLSVNKGLIWAFVGPVLLILLCNLIILIITLRIMQSTAVHRLKTKSEKLRSVIRTIFLLSPMLGLTWVFGVLSVNSDLIVFQYLFAILNSLQGVFVFLCYCVLTYQIREGLNKMRQRSISSKSLDSGTRSTDSTNAELVTHKGKSGSDYDNTKPVIKMNPAFRNQTFGIYEKSD